LYIEIDDVLLHTYIYDENFGFMSDPYPREPEHILHYGDKRMPIRVYMRDCWEDFMNFLKENKSTIEPIIYTSGIQGYTDLLLPLVDPTGTVFEHRLYQNACYTFEKKDEDIFYMIKDVARFKNTGRDLRRAVLVDPNPLNFMLTPENGLPALQYNAELDTKQEGKEKDEYLKLLIEHIKELSGQEDVRKHLREHYNVR
jgi:TFIIF-interacting CTD phosphatase-like protein